MKKDVAAYEVEVAKNTVLQAQIKELKLSEEAYKENFVDEVELGKKKDEVIEMMKQQWDEVYKQPSTWLSSTPQTGWHAAIKDVRDIYWKVTGKYRHIPGY